MQPRSERGPLPQLSAIGVARSGYRRRNAVTKSGFGCRPIGLRNPIGTLIAPSGWPIANSCGVRTSTIRQPSVVTRFQASSGRISSWATVNLRFRVLSALAADSVVVAVEPMRIRRDDLEPPVGDLS